MNRAFEKESLAPIPLITPYGIKVVDYIRQQNLIKDRPIVPFCTSVGTYSQMHKEVSILNCLHEPYKVKPAFKIVLQILKRVTNRVDSYGDNEETIIANKFISVFH